MATTYKVLGQLNPSATAGTFRLAIRPAGATLSALHYISYDTSISANDSISLTIGITLATTDVITVYASTGTMSFAAFGSEIT